MRIASLMGLVGLMALAGCGGHQVDDTRTALATANSPLASVRPPRFDDADPHDWQEPSPAALAVHGIDVARWQSAIDWPAARAAGVNFAFIKATEGGDGLNPEFQRQWQGAAQAGIPRGAYHFYYFCTPPEVQAAWFIRTVPRTPGALPPVLDLEWNAHSPSCRHRPEPAEVRRLARRFADLVAAHYGQRPILYMPVDFYEQNQMILLDHEEFWLRSVSAHPTETFPGAGYSFWQYSGTGLVPGITGKVDLNAFNGSTALWSRWLASRRH